MLKIQREIIKLVQGFSDEQMQYAPVLERALEIICNNQWFDFESRDESTNGLRLELAFKYASGNRHYQHCVFCDIEDKWTCCNTGEDVDVDNVTHWRFTYGPEESA